MKHSHAHNAIKHAPALLAALANSGAHTAFKIIDAKHAVRATRIRFTNRKGRVAMSRYYAPNAFEIVLTSGRSNAQECAFIKLCVRAGERFPVKRVQLRGLHLSPLYRKRRAR